MEVLMRWNNLFSAHALLLSKDKSSHWRQNPKFFRRPCDASWLHSRILGLLRFFSLQLLLRVHNLTLASPTLTTDTGYVRRWNLTGAVMYCDVYLPVVQPPLQVLVVLSFLGSPGRENRDKVDCTPRGLYSMYWLLCAIQYEKAICILLIEHSETNVSSQPIRSHNQSLRITL